MNINIRDTGREIWETKVPNNGHSNGITQRPAILLEDIRERYLDRRETLESNNKIRYPYGRESQWRQSYVYSCLMKKWMKLIIIITGCHAHYGCLRPWPSTLHNHWQCGLLLCTEISKSWAIDWRYICLAFPHSCLPLVFHINSRHSMSFFLNVLLKNSTYPFFILPKSLPVILALSNTCSLIIWYT